MPKRPASKRLAIARLSHEGNSFSPLLTGQEDFARREWVAGAAARTFYRGSRSELGAAVAFLEARPDWGGTFLRCAAAPPGGPVESALLAAVRDEILEGLRDGPWDGVYLSLHGAMIGPQAPRADLDLVAAVRAAIGATPLALTFDLHANLDPALADHAEILLGYKTYPHVDTYETGVKALDLLSRAAEGEIAPVSRVAPVGALLPSFNMRTDQGPMAEMEAAARRLAAARGLLDVTPFGGFAYGDVPQAGASVTVCADGDAALAARAAVDLAAEFRARRGAFLIHLPGAEAALREALADRSASRAAGPVAVLEPADNPMSGGIGDTPGLFRALLAARPGMDPASRVAFAFFCDPELVARARDAGPGAALDATLGGRLTGDFGPPVAVTARVARLTEGRFVNQGPMERGLPVDLGPTAVLEFQGIEIIITSACVSPNDAAYFALHGIELARLDLLCVKAKNHFRAAFAQTFARLIDADTPGPAALDLAKLPFRRVPPARLPPYTNGGAW
jgi:microcystin degradation protein MlrC